jgi:hypothetical protein
VGVHLFDNVGIRTRTHGVTPLQIATYARNRAVGDGVDDYDYLQGTVAGAVLTVDISPPVLGHFQVAT